MGESGRLSRRPFSLAIEQWKAVGGGVTADGELVTKPAELVEAELIDGICQRYGCLPSALMEEDADLLLGTLALVGIGKPDSGE